MKKLSFALALAAFLAGNALAAVNINTATKEELDAQRAKLPEKQRDRWVYPGTCRPAQGAVCQIPAAPHAWRLRIEGLQQNTIPWQARQVFFCFLERGSYFRSAVRFGQVVDKVNKSSLQILVAVFLLQKTRRGTRQRLKQHEVSHFEMQDKRQDTRQTLQVFPLY